MPARSVRAALADSRRGAAVDTRQIESRLRYDVLGLQGSYGVAVVDLATGVAYGVNAGTTYRAASLNKVPILIALYLRAGAGTVSLDQSLTVSEEDIQHYGTGLIQDHDSSRTYNLRELAALMIETSDNTAAYVLERFLGQTAVQADVERWGLTHTSMGDNATTPADVATLFSDLYRDRLLPSQTTDIALTLLQHTVFSDRLVSGLPEAVAVAHKVGNDVGVFNDAGLVLAPAHPYAIALLSQNAGETEAHQVFARISQDVYRFEQSLPAAEPR